jgi:hypothetical protein
MAIVSNQRIWDCIANNLQALSGLRGKQENLIRFANMQGFTLRDVDRSFSHAIVMGARAAPGTLGRCTGGRLEVYSLQIKCGRYRMPSDRSSITSQRS